ncbi:UvrD-helicase domain-containing protein [Legionella dresdenensis]|uniref:DNA 3'-5' helicase n=1 Tax=Legionella dresdenensis TaxID=450200 RepID=A0ABV8CHH4_9GAMM
MLDFNDAFSKATPEQQDIIKNASTSSAIISCPGSGKTFTVALRMIYRLANWESTHSGIALLSHTNIAITSFEKQFKELGYSALPISPHFVGTLDGFITRFLLLNFGHIVMGCEGSPTLVRGNEKIFNNQTQLNVFFSKFPINVVKLKIGIDTDGTPLFYSQEKGISYPIKQSQALQALTILGKQGFYTHDHARYWGSKILDEIPRLREILARRFPEIIVDEAQDTNIWQQRILCNLEQAGTQLMLVGDPDQAIFEFGMGNADHLNHHAQKKNVDNKKISKNIRSNQTIVTAIKPFGEATDMFSNNICSEQWQGAFFIKYNTNEENSALEKFSQYIRCNKLDEKHCAVIARSRDMVKKLTGDKSTYKSTVTHRFAKASLERDCHKNLLNAFDQCKELVLNLCEATQKWKALERDNTRNEIRKEFIKKLWSFVSDVENGLPCASLKAKSEWHPQLKKALQALCEELSSLEGFICPQKLGVTIKNTDLSDEPISSNVIPNKENGIHINTVHGVKGDTFDAVLYIMTEEHLKPLVNKLKGENFNSELLKIGYVAMTRPRHLLWLAIPAKAFIKYQQLLINVGFQHIPSQQDDYK